MANEIIEDNIDDDEFDVDFDDMYGDDDGCEVFKEDEYDEEDYDVEDDTFDFDTDDMFGDDGDSEIFREDSEEYEEDMFEFDSDDFDGSEECIPSVKDVLSKEKTNISSKNVDCNKQEVVRNKKPDSIFLNGSKHGEKSQSIMNLIMRILRV